MKSVRMALRGALHFTPTVIHFGTRYDLDNPKAEPVVDVRRWPAESDLFDSEPLTAKLLKEWAGLPDGAVVDLYVYSGRGESEELETNATLIVTHGGDFAVIEDGPSAWPIESWLSER